MSAADHGWPDVKPGDKSKYHTCRCGFRYQREQDLFDHVYSRALEDAADEQERLSTGPLAMGSKAVAFKRLLFAEWLRDRAASVAPRERRRTTDERT